MDSPLNRTWLERPEVIRGYYDMLPINQRLCDEVKYILEKKIRTRGVEVGNISARAKTLISFCDKIERKKYKDPLDDVTDLSGVRIVFLYNSDRLTLEQLVEDEFEVLEKVDKVGAQGIEKFGYGALHYVVSLKEQHAGARYDDLRGIRCEIQIRTILQDAWAIVAHHLSYKHEADIPDELKRKLHALSGLFETADDQFERLNHARIEYQNRVKESIKENFGPSLDEHLNLDSLLGYMESKFPDRDTSCREAAADLLEELKQFGYKNLRSVDAAVNKAWKAVLASEEKYPPVDQYDDEPVKYLGVGLLRSALEFVDDEYFCGRHSENFVDKRGEFAELLNQDQ